MRHPARRPGTRSTKVISLAAVIGLAALLLSMTAAAPASAHAARKVGGYSLVVGFGDEPAYSGGKNSVQLVLSGPDGKPVTDLGDSLRVMVMAAGQSTDLPLEPQFEVGEWGTPGDYRAFFIPTSPGRYTFHFHGTVKGQKVSQAFTSSPSTFSDVEDPAKVMFPVKEPSSGELAQRLDREVPRLSVAVQSAQAASRTAEQRARDAAGQARLLALAGAVTGLLGLAVAVVAFRRKPTVRVVTERRREPASAGRA